jgi:hypothetical protein
MLLQLAKDEFRPWLDYLASTPGIDKKVIVSNNDRMFRILWKCAAAIEKKEVNINETLVYRSAAVEYMAQCPTYTKPYCLQQVIMRLCRISHVILDYLFFPILDL